MVGKRYVLLKKDCWRLVRLRSLSRAARVSAGRTHPHLVTRSGVRFTQHTGA